MPSFKIRVTAPSRLHFGMFSFGHPGSRQFGGVGLMLERPGLELLATASETWEATGPLAERALEFARRWSDAQSEPATPARIEILSAPGEHVGLGTGTQLGLAVAAALRAIAAPEDPTSLDWSKLPDDELARLAQRIGRGRRSAIGLNGFAHGGLLMESGKAHADDVSPVVARQQVPEAWRFVLVRPQHPAGLSGEAERGAFERLPPVPPELTVSLCRMAMLDLLPALRARDFGKFSQSLHQFGLEAGRCFAPVQGGVFASPQLASLVDEIRGLGIVGVGQSSWGPTLFALVESQAQGVDLVQGLAARHAQDELEFVISPADNHGARIARVG